MLRIACVSAMSLGILLAAGAQAPVEESQEGGGPDVAVTADGRRPKIGLALSGGGARGAAHVGVLRVLEEMRIPVDYIAGTSMGSIVGGLYSIGMTPDEIEEVLTTTDWDAVFNDRPPRKDLNFRKKEDDHRYIVGLEAGLSMSGLRFGKGLIVGQQLQFLLESLTLPAAQFESFGDFPIPFHCVATDIVTGERVVLSKGNLAMAIRASMSIPAVFNPVELEGRLLVDGGISQNLPVETAFEMGADIVIAVDISTPPAGREELKSFLSISSQMVSILMDKNLQASKAKATILLSPPIGNFSNMDFPHADSLIPIGEQTVRDRAAELQPYALNESDFAEHQKKTRTAPPLRTTLDFVRYEGMNPKEEAIVRGKTEVSVGEPLDLDSLKTDLESIYDSGDYESVSYRLLEEHEKYGIVISAIPNPLGPIYVRFGLRLGTDFDRRSDNALLLGLRWTRLNRLNAEWKTDLEFGLTRGLSTEFYQPLSGRGRFFVAARLETRVDTIYVYEEDRAVGSYRTSYGIQGVDFGFNLGRYGEVRFGPQVGSIRLRRDIGFPPYPSGQVDLGSWRLRVILDHLNSTDFPTQGYYSELNGMLSDTGLGADDRFQRVDARWSGYGTRGKHTYFARVRAGTSLGSDLPYYSRFYVGGPETLAGFEEGQISGNYSGTLRFGYYFRLAKLPAYLGEGLYLISFADVGNAWESAGQISWTGIRYSGSLALGGSTKLGPVYLGISYARGGYTALFFSIGKRF